MNAKILHWSGNGTGKLHTETLWIEPRLKGTRSVIRLYASAEHHVTATKLYRFPCFLLSLRSYIFSFDLRMNLRLGSSTDVVFPPKKNDICRTQVTY
jgi:hypothetical protein